LFIFSFGVFFGFFAGCGSVCPGSYAGLFQGLLGEYHVTLGTHLCGMPNVSLAGLELVSGSMGTFLFSQYNVAWRSFVWDRGSGCQNF
jgi:hypothetical protein